MPYCPSCEAEYRKEIQTCPECGVKLVDRLDPGPEMSDLEVLCTVIQEENAYILRGFLESEGIPCQLENLSFHATPAPGSGLTRVRLWIKKDDGDRARKLIHEHEQFTACSSCGHVVQAQDTVCDFCGETLESV